MSIILDKDDYDAINERMHQEMQRDFVPFVLVNKIPEERISFFVCSTQEIADAQLKKHGYKIKALVSPGKGVAEKI